jgi:hypothetical protein
MRISGGKPMRVPTFVKARFKNDHNTTKYEIVSALARGGTGHTFLYKNIYMEKKRSVYDHLVLKLTNESTGKSHFFTESMAPERISTMEHTRDLFIETLVPNNANDRFYINSNGTKACVTIMQFAVENMQTYMFYHKDNDSDVAVVLKFIEKLYTNLKKDGYFYKDMKLDQLLRVGDENDPLSEESLKIGDLGNVCSSETSLEKQACERFMGYYSPSVFMRLTPTETLHWQKYLICCQVFFKNADEHFLLLNYANIDENYRYALSDLLEGLKADNQRVKRITDVSKCNLLLDAIVFFEEIVQNTEFAYAMWALDQRIIEQAAERVKHAQNAYDYGSKQEAVTNLLTKEKDFLETVKREKVEAIKIVRRVFTEEGYINLHKLWEIMNVSLSIVSENDPVHDDSLYMKLLLFFGNQSAKNISGLLVKDVTDFEWMKLRQALNEYVVRSKSVVAADVLDAYSAGIKQNPLNDRWRFIGGSLGLI